MEDISVDQGPSPETVAQYEDILQNVFDLDQFRPDQLDVIIETTKGQDTIILMPTGSGKSLCFQLPAVYENDQDNGVTVVVSPLRALIEDQVDALNGKGIDAVAFTSRLPDRNSNPALVYVTPEKLQKRAALNDALWRVYRAGRLRRFVIDEAHCIVMHGDFRDAYRELHTLREGFPDIPIMALTAAANPRTMGEIVRCLKLKSPEKFEQSLDRPNLHYSVKQKRSGFKDVVKFILNGHSKESGIVYCTTRNASEYVADRLVENGISACHFHGGLGDKEQKAILREWKGGDFHVVAATIAFGMGINKPDVRFVIHYNIPSSLENYYQEAGRAGRDGKPAECILWKLRYGCAQEYPLISIPVYRYQDRKSILGLASSDEDPVLQSRREHAVDLVVSYCENQSVCRRVQLLEHFGQGYDQKLCQGRDNCTEGETNSIDLTKQANLAIQLVRPFNPNRENITTKQFIAIFRGADTVVTRKKGRNRKPRYSAGRELSKETAELLFGKLLQLNVFVEKRIDRGKGIFHHYLKVGIPYIMRLYYPP
ncbi:P-loop containing nucleoside triphosphate hydrolase protein [Mycena vitilis]|nr:P-loop containing nucleoside triphosphate hydrolase protein [Mycena vitilis]